MAPYETNFEQFCCIELINSYWSVRCLPHQTYGRCVGAVQLIEKSVRKNWVREIIYNPVDHGNLHQVTE